MNPIMCPICQITNYSPPHYVDPEGNPVTEATKLAKHLEAHWNTPTGTGSAIDLEKVNK